MNFTEQYIETKELGMQLSRLQTLTMLHNLIDKDIENAQKEYESTVKKLDVIGNRLLDKNRERNMGLGEAWFIRKEKVDKAKEHLIACLKRKLELPVE
jgi:hypothetical protein